MLASARPSSLGKAGADVVSVKLFPMFVERNTFMPKNGLQLEAYRRGVPRVSISVEYTGTPGPKGPRSAKRRLGFAAPAQYMRSGPWTWIVMVGVGPML